MTDEEMLAIANEIANPYQLKAIFLGEACSVGVMGDGRTVTRVIVLEGPYVDQEILADISTEISNRSGINRVTLHLAGPESS